MRSGLKTALFLVVACSLPLSAESFDYTGDSYFSRPTTIVTWRSGLGLSQGPCFTSELRTLINRHLELSRVVADVEPNMSIVDMVWMSLSFDYNQIDREPVLHDILSVNISLGPYFKGFRVAGLGNLKWYAGPSVSFLVYFFSPNRHLIWYSDAEPLMGVVPGAEAGAELFFSAAVSCFIQARYSAGKVESWHVDTSGALVNYDAAHKNIGLFQVTAGCRFYFGQNQSWTPAGFAER